MSMKMGGPEPTKRPDWVDYGLVALVVIVVALAVAFLTRDAHAGTAVGVPSVDITGRDVTIRYPSGSNFAGATT